MLVHRKRLPALCVLLHVVQRPFREPHLLPLGIRHIQDLLPDLIRILPLNRIRRRHEIRFLLLADQIVRQFPVPSAA